MGNGKEKEWPTGGEPERRAQEGSDDEHRWPTGGPTLFVMNSEVSPVDVSTLLESHGLKVQRTKEVEGGLHVLMNTSSRVELLDAVQVLRDSGAGEDVSIIGDFSL
ncbi:hypothetical protein Snoj_32440 [Streptomyces nojiriensis]|uniref:DUF2007 domain-containing protein n=1 Tax=Streptomyces nojiriensis TaxID=66374 RepID=A0ABQ3SMG2_9ACTN|nr:hypothetical protein GCM10010205_74570 [Streptomyces nojiriensis]GHI69326.1 hypothetical protein Snoj_32440 [Streptomyces nojiriensis]